MKKYKYSIVTSLFNDYEILKEIEHPVDDVEYIVVTDNPYLTSNTWKPVLFNKYDKIDYKEIDWVYVKYFPFEFCSSDKCFYIDGSIKIKEDITPLMEYLVGQGCEYATGTEYPPGSITPKMITETWSKFNIIDPSSGEKIIKYLEENNFSPDEYGVLHTALIFRQNTQFVKDIDTLAWNIMKSYDEGVAGYKINQEALTSSVKRIAYHNRKFRILDQNLLWSPWFSWCYHGTDTSKSLEHFIHSKSLSHYYNNCKTAYQNSIVDPIKYSDIMHQHPLLTVVITCYNKEKTIKRAINSVKNISYTNWECIIVDNDSSDDSADIILNSIEGEERFMLVSQRNKNVCNSRNTGAFLGKGKYLVFLDGDDEIGKYFCEEVIAEMEKNENICIGTGIVKRVYANDTQQFFYTTAEMFSSIAEKDRIKQELIINKFFVTSVLRLDRYKAIGGHREGTEYTQEDWEMFVRYFCHDISKTEVTYIFDNITHIAYQQEDSKTKLQNLNWENPVNERYEEYVENPQLYEKYLDENLIQKIKNREPI